jgi:alkylation response protein AidB-like acyl-CoA dehydrogenase
MATNAQRAEDLDLSQSPRQPHLHLRPLKPDAPKHKGISFLLVDMRQPGIEVRPIRMISGGSDFNKVFCTEAESEL